MIGKTDTSDQTTQAQHTTTPPPTSFHPPLKKKKKYTIFVEIIFIWMLLQLQKKQNHTRNKQKKNIREKDFLFAGEDKQPSTLPHTLSLPPPPPLPFKDNAFVKDTSKFSPASPHVLPSGLKAAWQITAQLSSSSLPALTSIPATKNRLLPKQGSVFKAVTKSILLRPLTSLSSPPSFPLVLILNPITSTKPPPPKKKIIQQQRKHQTLTPSRVRQFQTSYPDLSVFSSFDSSYPFPSHTNYPGQKLLLITNLSICSPFPRTHPPHCLQSASTYENHLFHTHTRALRHNTASCKTIAFFYRVYFFVIRVSSRRQKENKNKTPRKKTKCQEGKGGCKKNNNNNKKKQQQQSPFPIRLELSKKKRGKRAKKKKKEARSPIQILVQTKQTNTDNTSDNTRRCFNPLTKKYSFWLLYFFYKKHVVFDTFTTLV